MLIVYMTTLRQLSGFWFFWCIFINYYKAMSKHWHFCVLLEHHEHACSLIFHWNRIWQIRPFHLSVNTYTVHSHYNWLSITILCWTQCCTIPWLRFSHASTVYAMYEGAYFHFLSVTWFFWISWFWISTHFWTSPHPKFQIWSVCSVLWEIANYIKIVFTLQHWFAEGLPA